MVDKFIGTWVDQKVLETRISLSIHNGILSNLYRILSYDFHISQWCLIDAVHTQICEISSFDDVMQH